MEFDPSSLTLEENGVCVQRNICNNSLCEVFLAEISKAFDRMLALPGRMSSTSSMPSLSGHRHFLTIATSPYESKMIKEKEFTHRRDFRLPYNSLMESVLLRSLNSNTVTTTLKKPNTSLTTTHHTSRTVGHILIEILGENAELCEISVIRSEPACEGQSFHSDSEYSDSNPRLCTVFLALHDIPEETMGPTQFYANTHHPRHFEDNLWVPPTPGNIQNQLNNYPNKCTELWFGPLHQGDAVLMDSCTWHRGGANTSNKTRTILAISFVEEAKLTLSNNNDGAQKRLKLGGFVNDEKWNDL